MEKNLSKYYIPKKVTQQEEFLQKYPIYDGRGIKIAVIDSGVDVSLEGLQKTSTGLPKIMECFDYTGAGDVDTSTVKKIGKENTLILLSGRKVKIPDYWKNPSNKWHLGIKPMYEIQPQKPDHIKKKECEQIFQERKTETTKPKAWKIVKNENVVAEKLSENNNFDCIVWNNGQKWQACIFLPTYENLENAKVLTNFRDEHEYFYITENLACCVRIHDSGNFLELFIPRHGHGSGVAQLLQHISLDNLKKMG